MTPVDRHLPQTQTQTQTPHGLDLIDRKIVAALMADATTPIARIADKVGLSQTPCWKRIQRLEASGVILRRVALADPVKLGFGLTVFVGIAAPDHGSDWRATFARALAALPEVIEAWRMAGDVDYLLRVAVPDMAAYDRFYTALTDAVPIRNVTAQFAMEAVRQGTAYPVNTTDR
ncbi:Lrp/AsnC family transcriptional regulator [Paracoccus nototheniae]|uniref:Lrp/AsnC family transcriptional regulator n=1 Tax=Paracoccus nototheniae TaxID=2489002 RepID=A0ABW4DVB5_9RHOB|nr:Lrp/AsnC family transcriptional regulator [Paracoccus nototheniae]